MCFILGLPLYQLCDPKFYEDDKNYYLPCPESKRLAPIPTTPMVTSSTTDPYPEVVSVTAFEDPSYWKKIANEMHGQGKRGKMHVGQFKYVIYSELFIRILS